MGFTLRPGSCQDEGLEKDDGTADVQAMTKRRFRLTLLMAGFVVWCMAQSAASVTSTTTPAEPMVLTLRQGTSRLLGDANLTVTLLEVQDFTSAGCLGGARGCPDYARINISTADSTQEFQLYLAHTQDQHNQKIDQAFVFGYRFTLYSLERNQATVVLERQK
jgi:hypothetical protein